MTEEEVRKLKPGDFVEHRQLGKCRVVQLQWTAPDELFGVLLAPRTYQGVITLARMTKAALFTPLMETTYRFIKPYS